MRDGPSESFRSRDCTSGCVRVSTELVYTTRSPGGPGGPRTGANDEDDRASAVVSAGPVPGDRGLPWLRKGIDVLDEERRHAPVPARDGRRVRRVAPLRRRLRGAATERPDPRLLPLPGRPRRARHLLRPDGPRPAGDPRCSGGDPDSPPV